MKIIDRYPIVVTSHKQACRDFWQQHFDLDVLFDSDWFVLLGQADQGSVIAFMTPDHPSAPPGPECFNGQGACIELEVADADAALQSLTDKGVEPHYPLTREAFGQKRFGLRDPAGVWIDVVEQVEPEAGYWDQYMQTA
ncbi:MAG: VOC family protein [Pseudomonadales bacterium]|nr:VOC family protein [Pseudomonadales bacterium]